MIDIDLHNLRIVSPRQLDLVQVENVQRIETENKHLKYALVVMGVVFISAIIYSMHYHNKSADTKKKHE